MTKTKVEIEAELVTINAALQELIAGTRLTRLQVGSGEFSRVYEYEELSYENLKAEKQELLAELGMLEPTQRRVFRQDSSIPLTYTKFPRGSN